MRFYVSLTWDDWPEGGSFGTVVDAINYDEAERKARAEMATHRAEGRNSDLDEDEEPWTCERILAELGDEWHVVDCFPLDDFIRRHTL